MPTETHPSAFSLPSAPEKDNLLTQEVSPTIIAQINEQAPSAIQEQQPSLSADERLRLANDSARDLQATFLDPATPGGTAVGNFLVKAGNGINGFQAGMKGRFDATVNSVINFSKTVGEVRNDCRDRINQWDSAKQDIKSRLPELGFKKEPSVVSAPEAQPILNKVVPVVAAELVQPSTEVQLASETIEQPVLTTQEKIRGVFDTIETMNADGGKFDKMIVAIKRFKGRNQPEVVEAALQQMFGENTEIAKAVMEIGLDNVQEYSQDLKALGVSSEVAANAWEGFLSNPQGTEKVSSEDQEISEKLTQEVAEPILSNEQIEIQRIQELREQISHGEGKSKSDLNIRLQGSLLATEGARLATKLEQDPAEELESFYQLTSRTGDSERSFNASYEGFGNESARIDAARKDIAVKTEVLTLLAQSEAEVTGAASQMELLRSKLAALVGSEGYVDLNIDTGPDGQPIQGFEPKTMTFGIEYKNGGLTINVKNKQEADASIQDTLHTTSTYTQR